MFNSLDMIIDNELTELSYLQGINKEFTLTELLSSDLWLVTVLKTDTLYKCIPLFNCDFITSTNPKDSILDDNKCLILFHDTDTIISCITDDTGGIHYHSTDLYAFTPYTSLDVIDSIIVYCIVYDEYLNTLNNVEVNVLINNEVTATIRTDNQGQCRYKIDSPCTVEFQYGGTVSNSITIGE